MIKYDCFAYNKLTGNCSALRARRCRNCTFYKTKDQHIADQRQSVRRLKELGYVDIDGVIEVNNKKYPARGW